MQAMIDELAKLAEESLGQVSSKETLATFWQEYLSKNGKIPALMKNLRSVAPEERPAMGKIINELKQKVQADYDAAAAKVKEAELAARNAAETVDITLPAKTRTVGGLHPLTLVTNQIIDVFSGMGFADPHHGQPEAAHQGADPRPCVPFRFRCHPQPHVPPDGRPGRG